MTAIDRLGAMPLFLGVETEGWALSAFQNAVGQAKTLGATSLLLKVADGGNAWYGALGGWQKVVDVIKAAGLPAIPYTYSYGNKFGAIQAEIGILKDAMQYTGIVIADMEAEYNGQTAWAQTVCNALKPIPGVFGVTTFADPVQQNWTGILASLAPCVNFWMPQVYSDFLASVYQTQFASYNAVYPVLNLGTDFGANNITQIAQTSHSPVIGLWWYEPAIGAYTSTVKQIAAIVAPKIAPGTPAGWSDDGTTLTAPNQVTMRNGFRLHVLSAPSWDPGNVPLAPEQPANPVQYHNPALGGGTIQPCRDCVLWWTSSKGVVQEPFGGLEIWACYQLIEQLQSSQKSPLIASAAIAVGNVIATLQDVQKTLSS